MVLADSRVTVGSERVKGVDVSTVGKLSSQSERNTRTHTYTHISERKTASQFPESSCARETLWCLWFDFSSMCDDKVIMVTTETHQSQDLLVPPQDQDQMDQQEENQASPSSTLAGFNPETMSQGPVNAITVLTLLDKLVNMLDTVQENQNKMEVSQGWGHTSTSGVRGGFQDKHQSRKVLKS